MNDPDQRRACHRLICSKVLLGMDDPSNCPEFLSAREGFNLEIVARHLGSPFSDVRKSSPIYLPI